MITKQEFVDIINRLRNYNDLQNKIQDLFRDNIENDDVKNTGFNLFLFKDTYCHTSRYTDYHGA